MEQSKKARGLDIHIFPLINEIAQFGQLSQKDKK